MNKTLRKVFLVHAAIFMSLLLASTAFSAMTKGVKVVVKDQSGRRVALYNESHALVIGVADYTAGWPDLESVPGEMMEVAAALERQGFRITKVINPNSVQLRKAFEDFIFRHGYDADNRLVFFFSGHGHTRKNGKKGYLIPTDAPDPRKDDRGFVQKALPMSMILAWAKNIEAKHAIFLFDSCFSGTIFKTKALPKIPPHISDLTAKPVRQFLTAGSAGQEVPAQSVFVPFFIRALRGDGDLNGDGYVTGTEMGMYLHDQVLSYNNDQSPQYGKIKDTDLDEGDLVFSVKTSAVQTAPAASAPLADKETIFWQAIVQSQSPASFDAYLAQYPNGAFASLARVRRDEIKKKVVEKKNVPKKISASEYALIGVWDKENADSGCSQFKIFEFSGVLQVVPHKGKGNCVGFPDYSGHIKDGKVYLKESQKNGYMMEKKCIPISKNQMHCQCTWGTPGNYNHYTAVFTRQ